MHVSMNSCGRDEEAILLSLPMGRVHRRSIGKWPTLCDDHFAGSPCAHTGQVLQSWIIQRLLAPHQNAWHQFRHRHSRRHWSNRSIPLLGTRRNMLVQSYSKRCPGPILIGPIPECDSELPTGRGVDLRPLDARAIRRQYGSDHRFQLEIAPLECCPRTFG